MSTAALRKRARRYEAQHGGRPRGTALAVAKRKLMGLMEKKVIDTGVANYACNTTGSVTLVNGCAQGTDFTNRVGRKYTNVTVQLEGLLAPVDTTTDSAVKCRVMLVWDSQANGALPSVTDVLTAATASSFMNLNNRDRFRVLCDENHTIGGISDVATQTYAYGHPINISVFKKVNLETVCDGTTSAIGDIQTGSIFLLTIGTGGAGVGAVFSGAVRVRFIDA